MDGKLSCYSPSCLFALQGTVRACACPGPWRLTGFDPEGLDLAAGERTARVAFPERLANPAAIRPTLVAMAAQARAIPGS